MPDLPLLAWLTLYAVAVVVILFFLFGRRDDSPVAPTVLHIVDSSSFEPGDVVRVHGRLLWVHGAGPGWIVIASEPPDE